MMYSEYKKFSTAFACQKVFLEGRRLGGLGVPSLQNNYPNASSNKSFAAKYLNMP